MLKAIGLKNFKCFKKLDPINFERLTILTGANSSGKSSILYSVLGAIQSDEFPFQFSTNGRYVNMGDFKEIAYNHSNKEEISIDFTFQDDEIIWNILTVWIEDKNNNLPRLKKLNAKSDAFDLLIVRLANKKYSMDFKYDPAKDTSLETYKSESFRNAIDKLSSALFEIVKDRKFSNLYEDFDKPQDIKGYIFEDYDQLKTYTYESNFRLHQTLDKLQKLFKIFDDKVNFISSFRLHPDRTYLERSKVELKVEKFGEGYLDQIILWETKKSSKLKELVGIMKRLSLLNDIRANRLEGGRYEMLIKTRPKGVLTSLSDVGFGISQFLPIIVADLQLPDDSTLFIAQPEIHLHPNVQSLFGEYITDCIRKSKKNYVIETHSEYFLNKLRLCIVKKELDPKDVSVYYIDSNTNVHKIDFTKTGQIINAPEDFFQTYMMDVMDIALNAE